jgi:hypothetical protein
MLIKTINLSDRAPKGWSFGLFTVVLLYSNLFCLGQQGTPDLIYDEAFLGKEFIEKKFEGGYAGYVDFFEANLTFPQQSYKNQIEGLQLFYYDIYPQEKKIEVTFLTLLDNYIEENIRISVAASFENWNIEGNGPFRIYQPVVYSMLPYFPHTLIGGIPELPVDLPLKFQQMFVLIKSKRIDPDFDLKKENDTTAKSNYQKNVYVRALKQYDQMTKIKELGYSYDALNEMIRYNPFDREFLMARIKLEQALGVNKYQTYDATLLGDFVDQLELKIRTNEPLITQRINGPRIIDSVYTDGQAALKNYLNNNLDYPPLSILNKTQGVILIEISGSIKSGLNYEPLTKLDREIEKSVLLALKESSSNWILSDKGFKVYLPIFFSLNHPYTQRLDGNVEGFTSSFNYPFMDGIEMIALESRESRPEPKHIKNYIKIRNKLDFNVERNKYKKAMINLNSLIRYNPFDSRLILARMAVEKELRTATYANIDSKLLEVLKLMK